MRRVTSRVNREVAIMAKWLVIIGVIFILVGVAWPWLSKLGIGHLPGDIYIERKGFSFYFPITTSIVISLVLSVLYWIFRK
jgi:amino acid transporter